MRFIRTLTTDEIARLTDVYQNGEKHYLRVKCKSLLMSNEGKTISEIASFSEKTPRTIRNLFDNFEQNGFTKLLVDKGRGIKAPLDTLTVEQKQIVKKELAQNYQNLKGVSVILSNKLGFTITKWMLKRFIKKNSIILGVESVKT